MFESKYRIDNDLEPLSSYTSGNMLAGYSIDYKKAGFKGIKDFRKLMEQLGDKNGEN